MGQLFWQRRYEELIELGEQATIDQPGGREAEARALARGNIDWHEAGLARIEELNWAPSLSKVCALLVLEQAEAALDVLETLPERSGVPRLPWLLDLACFDGCRRSRVTGRWWRAMIRRSARCGNGYPIPWRGMGSV